MKRDNTNLDSSSIEAAEFTDLLHESRNRIFGYIYSLVHNQADAEELFQETAIRLWQKFPEFERDRDFGRWATRFAHLTVLNFIRTNRRRREFLSEAILERIAMVHQREETEQSIARAEALASCMDRLPSKDQRLVESCYSGGLTMKEVATKIGRSTNAVYLAIQRVRRTLLGCIERAISKGNSNG